MGVTSVFDDLDKAERHWQRRSLFKARQRGRRWLAALVLVAVVVALTVWQQETLTWLADLIG